MAKDFAAPPMTAGKPVQTPAVPRRNMSTPVDKLGGGGSRGLSGKAPAMSRPVTRSARGRR